MKRKKPGVKVLLCGCPWCNTCPVASQLYRNSNIVKLECRNQDCPVQPSLMADSLTEAAEKWGVNNRVRDKDLLAWQVELFPKAA